MKLTLLENRSSLAIRSVSKQFSVISLRRALDVHDLTKSQPELKLWEIAQKLHFTTTLKDNEFGIRGQMASVAIGKKNTMGVAVRRKLDMAASIIDGVGKGAFPKYKL